jgi:DNA-binding MarR family transcriptional regulator
MINNTSNHDKIVNYLSKNESILLLWLFHHKEGNINKLLDDTTIGQFAMYSAINKLEKLKLIDEKSGPNRSRIIYIKEKGKLVAKKLEEINTIIENSE